MLSSSSLRNDSAPAIPRVVSVNVGEPREVVTRNSTVLTSIFKTPVQTRISLHRHNLEGDRQSDLRVHGGPYKAVYAYSSEHYGYWAAELPGMDLPFGVFGENLTTAGLTEDVVYIGDEFRIGTAIVRVTQPRMPCFKLALRFGRSDIVKRFWNSGYAGVYFGVVEEGELAAGDEIVKTGAVADEDRVTIADVVKLYKGETYDAQLLERVLRSPLYGGWKEDIRERWEARPMPLF